MSPPTQVLIIGVFFIAISFVSAIASGLTIWLIYDMKNWSGYILLVFSLSVSQLIYELGLLLNACYGQYYCNLLEKVITLYGGIATSCWSNLMSFVLLAIVAFMKTPNVKKYYLWMFGVVTLTSLAFAISGFIFFGSNKDASEVDAAYCYFRMASIFVNVLVYISCLLTLRGYNSFGSKAALEPISILVVRFSYYPLCQAITRAGGTKL